MSRKEEMRLMIDKVGLREFEKMSGLSLFEILRYTNYPIDNPIIMYDVVQEYFEGINNKFPGYITYKEYTIDYDRFEGLVTWSDVQYVEKHGGGTSFEFYVTPFFNGTSIIPITLSALWMENVDETEPMNVIDEVDDYYKIIEVNHKEISGLDKFLEWLKTDYLETACRGIRKLKAEIIKYEKL
jgi:hypothetical protein